MNTYWQGNGKYQGKRDQIWKDHIPEFGECKLVAAERLRCIARLYYDYYNNGWCNWEQKAYERAVVKEFVRGMENRSPINWSEDVWETFYHPESGKKKTAQALEDTLNAILLDSYQRIYGS